MDHPRGSKLYRFDMSLMERLAMSGLPMSRIDVQRRMPDVRGMVKNLVFGTHTHMENGGMDDTASRYNVYEVRIQSV